MNSTESQKSMRDLQTWTRQSAGIWPGVRLERLIDLCERQGYDDPKSAWKSYTNDWNWTTQLHTTIPAESVDRYAAVDVGTENGYLLSGRWYVSAQAWQQRWLALPLPGPSPKVFVVATGALTGQDRLKGEIRVDEMFVPAGFVANAVGAPLRGEDAHFHWLGVTAMALGAARRVTDDLFRIASENASTIGCGESDGELSGILAKKHKLLAESAHSFSGDPDSSFVGCENKNLAASVEEIGRTLQVVVAMAYEKSISLNWSTDVNCLQKLVCDSTALLQHVPFATDFFRADSSGTGR